MLNKYFFIGGRHSQQGALGIATPCMRGKEAPPQEDADPNYLAPFVPLLTTPHVHGKSLSGPIHKWIIVLLCLHLNCRIM